MGAFIFIVILVVLNILVGCFLRGLGKINEEYDKSFEKYIDKRGEKDEYNNRTSSN